jgi:hypothetical protein
MQLYVWPVDFDWFKQSYGDLIIRLKRGRFTTQLLSKMLEKERGTTRPAAVAIKRKGKWLYRNIG